MAANCPRAVLDTNIQSANREQIAALEALEAQIVEVRCVCPAQTAIARYAERARIGHPAQRFTSLDAERLAAYANPIGVGPLVEMDTRGEVDLDRLVGRIGRLLSLD